MPSEKSNKKLPLSIRMGGAVAIVILAIALWYFFGRAGNNATQAEGIAGPSVVLQEVGVMPIQISESAIMPQRYTATVAARRTSQLAFQASERIDEVLVDEGDTVSKGQLLARQDESTVKAVFQAAQARTAQSAAVLAELESGPREETIESARADLVRLQAQSNQADSNYQRMKSLLQSSASSAEEFDVAKFEALAARGASNSAKQKLDELLAGTRKEQIDAQRAVLAINAASALAAKTRLEQTHLHAPFAGRISRRFFDEGSLPQPGDSVLEIVENEHLEVRFGVSPRIAKQLQIGKTLTFHSGEQVFQATIKQIRPKLERSTRTQPVIASVILTDGLSLIDGETVEVQFAIRSESPGFWIPTEALQPQVRGLWSVLVVEQLDAEKTETKTNDDRPPESIARRRDVEVLATWGAWSRVRGTLEPSDRVIIAGGSRISAGQRVIASDTAVELPWQREDVVKLWDADQDQETSDEEVTE